MRDQEAGQLMIIVALGMVVLFGFAAVAVDLGNAYSQRRLAQNAADAAAMAAIRMVRTGSSATGASTVYQEITNVAALNGSAQVDPANTIYLDSNGNSLGPVNSYSGSLDDVAGVQVRTEIRYKTYFASVIGIGALASAARSSSMSFEPEIKGPDLMPMAVSQQSFNVGGSYTLWDSDTRGWVDFNGPCGGSGNSDVKNWIQYGFPIQPPNGDPTQNCDQFYVEPDPSHGSYSPVLPIPSYLQSDPGVRTSDLHAVENYRLNTTVTILVFDNSHYSQGDPYHIVGLAQFEITQVQDQGAHKYIMGTFQNLLPVLDSSTIPTTGDPFTVRMVQNNLTVTPQPTPPLVPTNTPTPTATATPATVTPTATPGGPTATPTGTPTTAPTPAPTATPTATPSPPAAPSGLAVTEEGKYTITLSWQDNSSNEQGFYIDRRRDGSTVWNPAGSVGPNVTTFTDSGLTHKTTYWYRVRAFNAGGDSDNTSPDVAGTTTP